MNLHHFLSSHTKQTCQVAIKLLLLLSFPQEVSLWDNFLSAENQPLKGICLGNEMLQRIAFITISFMVNAQRISVAYIY